MQRQSSRSTANADAIDCIVSTNDLILETEVLNNQEYEQRRGSSNSRRDQTLKRANEHSTHRSTRHSPPSVTRKRHSSPQIITSSTSSSRSHHHHHQHSSQRPHRISSPSSQSSSRHHRLTRPITSTKRPHSKSRSPYERHPPIHRSRPESSKERNTNDTYTPNTPIEEQSISKKLTSNQETADLSLISEDESTKIHDKHSNGITTTITPQESSSIINNNKLHSTPSIPILQPNSNENLLDMSTISQDYEISLFAKSALSTANTNSILTTSIHPTNDFIQTIDLISKYKMMQAIPHNNPQIEACSKEVLTLIQKQIELQKIELNYREREIKLRERELAEREKRFNDKSNDTTSTNSVNNEPLVVVVQPTIIEEKAQQKSEIISNEDSKNIPQDESVKKSIPSTIDILQVNSPINKNISSSIRKNNGKSRFSPIIVDPSIFSTQQKPVIDLYSDDHDDDQLSLSINRDNSLKKTDISKILAPQESTISIVDTDLKVISSNSCRKVEFQSGNIDKTSTNKGSTHDLRFTLKNRTKSHNNDKNESNNNQIINNNDDDDDDDGQQILTTNKPISTKINSNKEDKYQSHDYHQQRSITSTSIETIIDDTNDKRENRRHQQQRTNSNRQQQYSELNSSPSINNLNGRSYTHGSTSQQSSKYTSNQKRHESDDLRSRLFENKHSKPSRTTHRNNY